ncbi:MAG: BACON domain-containing protein [Bacteroidales bacterium]|jgi:hypothetical protein
MKKLILATVLMLFVFVSSTSLAQKSEPVSPTLIKTGKLVGISKPLSDIPPMDAEEAKIMAEKAKKRVLNPKLRYRSYPFAETALPKGEDPALQKVYSKAGKSTSNYVLQNFEGQGSPYYPPDANGSAGPNHYMQTVNTTYAIYSKTGQLLAGPTAMNQLFGSVPGAQHNDGDPLIQYDEMADRWVAVEFSISGSNDFMLMAVSTTNDPTGTWYQYSFDVDDMPDYEKLGIWRDGYYMGVNNSSSRDIYVFDRDAMLTGQPNPTFIGFDNPWRPVGVDGFMCVPPVDNDGTFAPAGTPGLFVAIKDDAFSGGQDELWIYELAVNWTNPSASTFNRVQQLQVQPFDSNFGNNWDNIAQPGVTRKLDAIPQVVMNVPQYRNFGSYQTIVCCHTVDVDNTNHAGIRWYELRKTSTGAGGGWSIRQQGTYAPDQHSRWMGSIAMNASGAIALGYSISSSTVYPGIRVTGQTQAQYQLASGIMDFPEISVQEGTASQSNANRWGDYSLMAVDPVDNITFWYTSQYKKTSSGNHTRIVSFKIGNNPVAITLDPTSVTQNSATLNGTVNPNTLATTYHFEWGTTEAYGNTTTTQSLPAGTTAVNVSADLSGLTPGTTYHYRITATNSDGTSYGLDKTFTPGGIVLTTNPVTSITTNSAVSGGNITSDGGSAITQRGVCWSTTENPTISDQHTSDGTGSGQFTSNITGLNSSTKYYVRAYATNSFGTFYGQQVSFTTNCGIYYPPFVENFNETTIPLCWTIQDNQNNGQVWQFGIMNVSQAPILTGNYAYIDSDTYGWGNSQNADLITPTIDLTGYSNVVLKFKHKYRHYTNSSGRVYYSIDDGNTWVERASYTTSTTANPTLEELSIPELNNQSNVKIKFNYTASWAYHWAIDDVEINGNVTNTLSVTPSNHSVDYQAGTVDYNVVCSGAWNAVSDQTWCTVTPSGNGNGTITANYTENTTTSQRVANITVTSTGLPDVTVTLTQAANTPLVLTVEPANHDVSSAAGNVDYTVTASGEWTAISNQTWCTVTPSGNGNGTITATYTENTNTTQRVANIVVSSAGLPDVTVTLTQAAATPLVLSVEPANHNVSADAGNVDYTVTASGEWTAASDQSWCSVTPSGNGNGTITATYTENTNPEQRIANITVSSTGLPDVVVTLTQEAATSYLTVTPAQQGVGYEGGSAIFNVSSNMSWNAVSSETWCTINPTSGTGDGSIEATVTSNASVNSRTATITVSAPNVPDAIVEVVQSGTTPYMSVTPSEIQVNHNAGTVEFNVSSNVDWTATSDAAWCTVTPQGFGNDVILADYEENQTNVVRSANITVNGSNNVANVVVTLYQLAYVNVDNESSRNVTVFPNPNNGKFIITSGNHQDIDMMLIIYDSKGNTVKQGSYKNNNNYLISIENLADGVYYLKVMLDNNKVQHFKLVKQQGK